MTQNGVLQIVLYGVALLALVKPLGAYMARVYLGQACGLDRVFGPLERQFYRLLGAQSQREMDWKTYAVAVMAFNILGIVALFLLQCAQGHLPFNPQQVGAVRADSALNTAISFVTNTNWQNYSGETTMSYLTQMLGMTVQNFLSAATGMAVLVALIRGIAGNRVTDLGNFWVDLTRTTLYILLPLSLILALVLVSQGVVQTFSPYADAHLISPVTDPSTGRVLHDQTLALGPAASQVAIKHLGANGGGFFNANASHPFENPNPITDFLLVLAQTVIAAALTYTFGRMVGDTRQGWTILAAMLIVLSTAIFASYAFESAGNSSLQAAGVDIAASNQQAGGNLEGKEQRFGIARSALFATTTTATSCGAVDSLHDSFTPLGGLIPTLLMQLSETILGGVGSGLYGMLAFVLLAVFIAGLMVGRTPEYLGKKIESFEMKMVALIVLLMPFIVLGATALALAIPAGTDSISNPGAHGLSQVLYAFSSMGNNNGSAFAGLNANTPFYNLLGAATMFVGRFGVILPVLAIAGSLAGKHRVPPGPGTLPTHTPLFVGLLIGTLLGIGALTFFPALALGPIAEFLQVSAGG